MSKSNKKKNRTNGTIPMKNKNIAIPVKFNNTNSNFTDNNELTKINKTNQLY